MNTFPTDYSSILKRIEAVDPSRYGRTRNFIDGSVTYLSPYVSRGVITLPQVRDAVLAKGYSASETEKFVQELAWRDYFQRVWHLRGDALFTDLKQSQADVQHRQIPAALVDAQTGIDAVDAQIRNLYATGYMHNHARMYVAFLACNLARAHWREPSRWLYFHLLDGDLASNTCSWQWVAGSFSSKKYLANQENINKYLHSNQRGTYLDKDYEQLLDQPVPEPLRTKQNPSLSTRLPDPQPLLLDPEKPLLLYNSYQLNPLWRSDLDANRVLVLEPSHFARFPVSDKVMSFVLALAQNIPGLQVFVGEAGNLPNLGAHPAVYSVAHPLTRHYPGEKDPYPWLFPQVAEPGNSFFAFWKKCERYL
ncbi:hypothetical protein GCM10023187_03430 [Nibrella viscosa]|uniref:Cryptochrome/DNA photolyase FAD-binding domain-containing protein n=1 Tax=Nibrella viscosa TaxID=1084524 RepID=A0ABP8JUE2_9BACT